jgi:formyltetrahydrofolate deformylase
MSQPDTGGGVLVLTCPDRPGIVAAVAGWLAAHDANIVDASQHTDRQARVFFMRVDFEPAGPACSLAALSDACAALAGRFDLRWTLHAAGERPRLAVLVSKEDHCLYDLLLRYRRGELAAEVPVVISNHDVLGPVAATFGVPFVHLPIGAAGKAVQEEALLAALDEWRIDTVVLARYMQVLSARVVARYPGRIVNIHHGFLPAFAGPRPYHQAYERGVKLIGATAHYVTEELDQGPIIDQDVIRVTHRDAVRDLVRKGRDLERVVLARAVRAHVEHRVAVHDGRTVVFD